VDQTLQKTHIPCNKKSSNLESGQFTSNFMNSTMFLATLLWSKQPLPAPYRRVLPRQPPGPDSMEFPWASQKRPMLRIHEDYVSKDRLGYIHILYMYVCIIMCVCIYIYVYIYHFLCDYLKDSCWGYLIPFGVWEPNSAGFFWLYLYPKYWHKNI
jgi:hypothetical protein